MAELLPNLTLSTTELATINRLRIKSATARRQHEWLKLCYKGLQEVKLLGLAVPPGFHDLAWVLNWNRVYVDALEERMDVKDFQRAGSDKSDLPMLEGWDYNDMEAQQTLAHRESLVQGCGLVSVGTNEDDKEHPLILAEPASNAIFETDIRQRKMTACLRLYKHPERTWTADAGTLYLPDTTVHFEHEGGEWKVTDRDNHKLGRIPVVPFPNRQEIGTLAGESQMADTIPITTMVTRFLASLQFAGEVAAIIKIILSGASKKDFQSQGNGARGPWESYMDAIWAIPKEDARVSTVAATDLNNFISVVDMLAQQMSAVTGLPIRYFGDNPSNPAAEGAIRADEARLIKAVERKNRFNGAAWSKVMALYERFRTGEDVHPNSIKVSWANPATPTISQLEDALAKRRGAGVLSREGYWKELDWTPTRIKEEKKFLRAEAAEKVDPYLARVMEKDAARKAANEPAPVPATSPSD